MNTWSNCPETIKSHLKNLYPRWIFLLWEGSLGKAQIQVEKNPQVPSGPSFLSVPTLCSTWANNQSSRQPGVGAETVPWRPNQETSLYYFCSFCLLFPHFKFLIMSSYGGFVSWDAITKHARHPVQCVTECCGFSLKPTVAAVAFDMPSHQQIYVLLIKLFLV